MQNEDIERALAVLSWIVLKETELSVLACV